MIDPDLVYDSAYWQKRLLQLLAGKYGQMLRAVHILVESAVGLSFELADPAVKKLLRDCAQQVVRIDTTTRNAIRERILAGYEAQQTTEEIAASIDELFTETWRGRPYIVARTELANAQVKAASDRYQASGVIDEMEIVDGTDWDDECRARNGTVVPVGTVVELNHPHCTLALIPIVKEPGP